METIAHTTMEVSAAVTAMLPLTIQDAAALITQIVDAMTLIAVATMRSIRPHV